MRYFENTNVDLEKALQCLINLSENWRQSLDQGFVIGALLIDLSRIFDCLLHKLLVAKLIPYGVQISSVQTHLRFFNK